MAEPVDPANKIFSSHIMPSDTPPFFYDKTQPEPLTAREYPGGREMNRKMNRKIRGLIYIYCSRLTCRKLYTIEELKKLDGYKCNSTYKNTTTGKVFHCDENEMSAALVAVYTALEDYRADYGLPDEGVDSTDRHVETLYEYAKWLVSKGANAIDPYAERVKMNQEIKEQENARKQAEKKARKEAKDDAKFQERWGVSP